MISIPKLRTILIRFFQSKRKFASCRSYQLINWLLLWLVSEPWNFWQQSMIRTKIQVSCDGVEKQIKHWNEFENKISLRNYEKKNRINFEKQPQRLRWNVKIFRDIIFFIEVDYMKRRNHKSNEHTDYTNEKNEMREKSQKHTLKIRIFRNTRNDTWFFST